METFADVIDAFGGSIALAAALEQPKGTVSAWKTRNSVPTEHWAAIVRLAAVRGVVGITHETLIGMVSTRKRAAIPNKGEAA